MDGGGGDLAPPPLKSNKSTKRSFVRFVNSTGRRADVLWIDYLGRSVLYKTLLPKAFYDVDTFLGHLWTFRDSCTKQKLVVRSQEVFFPRNCFPTNRTVGDATPVRRLEFITIPVYSLKEQCFYTISKTLKSKEDIYLLELPQTLLGDLAKFLG